MEIQYTKKGEERPRTLEVQLQYCEAQIETPTQQGFPPYWEINDILENNESVLNELTDTELHEIVSVAISEGEDEWYPDF